MTLRVVGAGLGRTGTNSLKLALEQLLGGPCYHMLEVIGHPDHAAEWERAAVGDSPDWARFLAGYVAAVDWPAAAFYEELMEAFPDAIVLLSTRENAEAWWTSANATIFQAIAQVRDNPGPNERMIFTMMDRRFTPEWDQHDASVAAYLRHNEEVRARVPAARLVEWTTGDGWGPLCRGLGLPEPDAPFPHVNTTSDFRAMTGLDRPG